MDKYFSINLLPDAEMTATVLMNAIYTKLHKRLFDLQTGSIGVSFPESGITLGKILRIHGDLTVLDVLCNTNWLGGMNGYCSFGDILTVPSNAKFRRIIRKQPNLSRAKINRLLKRGHVKETNPNNYITKMNSEKTDLPYLELVSVSTGQRHRRFIEMGDLLEQPISGEFDQFGLSKTATIPWF